MAERCQHEKPQPLQPKQAVNSFAHKLGPVADRIRQTIAVKLGIRPYRVFLVTTKWTGEERGEGVERVFQEREILPTPRVEMLTNVQNLPFPAGTLERGVLKVDRISVQFSEDDLSGIPDTRPIDANESFYWEIREDGRAGQFASRRRFRFLGSHRRADSAEFIAYIERMDEDRERDGTPGSDFDAEGP